MTNIERSYEPQEGRGIEMHRSDALRSAINKMRQDRAVAEAEALRLRAELDAWRYCRECGSRDPDLTPDHCPECGATTDV